MIYKYLDERTLQPVQDRTLKFAMIGDLNDPFENLARVGPDNEPIDDQIKRLKELAPAKKLLASVPPHEVDSLLKAAFETSAEKFDGSRHYTPTLLSQMIMQERTSVGIGILALTSSPKNGLMWSHYANKHQGYVLGFDDSHPFFQGVPEKSEHLLRLLPVQYSEQRIELESTIDKNEAFTTFLQKSSDWSYEQESRMLFPLKFCKEVSPGIHVIEYPIKALKEVIFGFKCDPTLVAAIRSSLEGEDVNYFRAIPSSISYDMEIESEDQFQSDWNTYMDWSKKELNAMIDLKAQSNNKE